MVHGPGECAKDGDNTREECGEGTFNASKQMFSSLSAFLLRTSSPGWMVPGIMVWVCIGSASGLLSQTSSPFFISVSCPSSTPK